MLHKSKPNSPVPGNFPPTIAMSVPPASGRVSNRPTREIIAAIASWSEEAGREQRKSLMFERPDFKHFLSGARSIVTGRKGAGKTAALSYVERQVAAWTPGKSLHPDLAAETGRPVFIKIDAAEIDLTHLAKVADSRALASAFWLNAIYSATLYHLNQIERGTHTGMAYTLNTLFQWIVGTGFNATISGVQIQLGGGSENNWQTRAEVSRRFLEEVGRKSPRGTKIFVAIDKLDSAFPRKQDAGGQRIYHDLMLGLMMAVEQINEKGATTLGDTYRLLPVVSKRSDIAALLEHAHSHLWFGETMAVTLKWTPAEARAMLAHRLSIETGITRSACEANDGKWFEANWNAIFDARNKTEINDPYDGTKKSAFNFMSFRTTWAPRDYVVQFSTLAGHADSNGGNKITLAGLMNGQPTYSDRFLKLVKSSAAGHIDGLDRHLNGLQNLISSGRSDRRQFEQSDVTSALRVATGHELLSDLYHLNIIGNYDDGEEGDGKYRFACRTLGLQPAFNYKRKVVIHPAIHRALMPA